MGQLPKPLKVKELNAYLNVLYGGVSLVKVNKATLKVFLSDLGPGKKVLVTREKVTKKRKPRVVVNNETRINAKQLVRAYTETKRKFFHSKAVNSVSTNSPDFKYFMEAVKIVNRHGVTYKKFLKAQIQGLSFISDGRGAFPKPSQLSTEAAEVRLLEYIRKHDETTVPVIKISNEERETHLMQNSKYLLSYDKIKDKTATQAEAVYVQELQQIRVGKVAKSVRKYLKRFVN